MGRTAVTADFWNGFDPTAERAILRNGQAARVPIPPHVRLLKTVPPTLNAAVTDDPYKDRMDRAAQLATDGHVVDVEIDIYGWPAADAYHLRRLLGVESVASFAGVAQILTPPAIR